MTKVALLYGGTSTEHDVSKLSAKNVRRALEEADLEVLPIFITKEGEWQLEGEEARGRALIAKLPELCDVAFPITHGTYGEDGSLQGLLSVLGVPYVGCDVIASAVCFDKEFTKRILDDNKLPVVEYRAIAKGEAYDYEELVATLGQTLFVKPARQGSSVGVSKATTAAELEKAVQEAFQFDDKILIERAVNGREIEFAVLEEKGEVTISGPGEIVVDDGFYDYANKYENDNAQLITAAHLTPEQETAAIELVSSTFAALSCKGMARVDCFLEDGKWYVNELNTIPGFTNISMYPKLLEVSGISQPELVKRLVQSAL